MNTVKCNRCGKINNFNVDTGALKGRVTFNCGSCQHPILSVDVDNRDVDWSKYQTKISNIVDFFRRRPRALFIPAFVILGIVFLNINSVNLSSSISNKNSVQQTKSSPAKSAFYQYSLEHRQMIQLALKGSYNYKGNIDGIWGPGTQAAYNRLRNFEPQNVNGLSHAQVYANIVNNVARQQNSYRGTNNDVGNYFMNRLIQQSPLFRQPAPPPSRSQTMCSNLGGGIINCNTTSQ